MLLIHLKLNGLEYLRLPKTSSATVREIVFDADIHYFLGRGITVEQESIWQPPILQAVPLIKMRGL